MKIRDQSGVSKEEYICAIKEPKITTDGTAEFSLWISDPIQILL